MRLLVSGTTRSMRRLLAENRDYLGILTCPESGNSMKTTLATGLPWAADNAAFSGFSAYKFRRFLKKIAGAPSAYFIAVPDVVCDARATLKRFHGWLPECRATGLPIAFVGQDGLRSRDVPWYEMDAFFIGGSTAWKLSDDAYRLSQQAKERGKHLHMGRVNSLMRLRTALAFGCDTVDGTGSSKWGDIHLPKLLRWLRQAESEQMEPTLFV